VVLVLAAAGLALAAAAGAVVVAAAGLAAGLAGAAAGLAGAAAGVAGAAAGVAPGTAVVGAFEATGLGLDASAAGAAVCETAALPVTRPPATAKHNAVTKFLFIIIFPVLLWFLHVIHIIRVFVKKPLTLIFFLLIFVYERFFVFNIYPILSNFIMRK
jgi:hypothetical protein